MYVSISDTTVCMTNSFASFANVVHVITSVSTLSASILLR